MAMAQNRIYFCAAGSIYAIHGSLGELLWRHELGSACPPEHGNVPVIADEELFFGTSGPEGAFYSLDAGSGELLWKRESRQAGDVLSEAADGMVYFSLDGNLAAARSATGELAWTFDTEGHAVSSLILSKGVVYASAGDKIFAVRGSGQTDSP